MWSYTFWAGWAEIFNKGTLHLNIILSLYLNTFKNNMLNKYFAKRMLRGKEQTRLSKLESF